MFFSKPRFQPYFCGQSDECRRHNSRSALSTAIDNVERHFPVVGVLEEMNRTLWAMQFTGEGNFFEGIWDAFGGTDLFGEISFLNQRWMKHLVLRTFGTQTGPFAAP